MAPTDIRTFLGFEAPFLAQVARALLAEHGSALSDVVVVLPGRRAGRRLLELLVEQSGGAVEPPRIVTEAGLAAALSKRHLSPASPAAVECAWFDVLSNAGPEEGAPFAPSTPSAGATPLRWALTRQLAALDREAATEETVRGVDCAPRELTPASRVRRGALAILSARVRGVLERAGRIDPARALQAIASVESRREGAQVVLAGVVEISPALRELLESLTPRPRVLIHAGQECAAGFDAFGAVVPEFWERREIPFEAARWSASDDPRAAIEESIAWLGELPANTNADSVAIGVLGGELLPGLTHALAGQGIALHSAAGTPLRESAPWLALDALQGWIAREDFAALAAVLRHPDLEGCLGAGVVDAANGDALARADAFHADHLPDALGGDLPAEGKFTPAIAELRRSMRECCGELVSGEERPLSAWTGPIVALLCRIYPQLPSVDSPQEARTRAALQWFAEHAKDLGGYGADFFGARVAPAAALRLWLDWSAEQALPAARAPGPAVAVEALGWLELAMEEAPHLLLHGLNDGWVPQSERTSPIAEAAGDDGERSPRVRTRLARDVHALTAIALQRAGSQASLAAISLRRGAGDDPLRPSRLLFHAAEVTAIERARTFFVDARSNQPPPALGAESKGAAPAVLPIPHRPPLRSVSVSAFRTFLQSPYLYYLEHALRLRRVRDDAWELEPKGYGSLLHEVLERFGRGERCDSTNPVEIEAFVLGELERIARERFGQRPLPAVRLQLQQLRRRLARFAECQASEASKGWRVHKAELKLEGAYLEVDGARIEIHGRVDRVDRHGATGRWRILDYKSGDDAVDPLKAHATRTRWIDLQLPLYRHFLAAQLPGEIELGYFAVVRKLEDCGVHLAAFTPEQLGEALGEARRLIGEMQAGDFARVGRARPRDRVQRALCGLSLLALEDEVAAEDEGTFEEAAE